MYGMIELTNGCIAVSQWKPVPSKIVVVDPTTYSVLIEIVDDECLCQDGAGSLSVLNENSFLYARSGFFCQIGFYNGKYQIVFKTKENEDELVGWGLIVKNKGKIFYTNSSNGKNGINLYECIYE